MTALIKSGSVGAASNAIRLFGTPPSVREPEASSREESRETRIAELEAEIVRREEELPQALADARSAGARDALRERSEAEADAIKALKRTLADAQTSWSQQLQSWEGLSVGIARAVLEQVFSDATDRSAKIVSAIKCRMQILEASSVVQLRVSSEDFSDADHLRSAAIEVGTAVELVSDSKLKSGECVIDLKLGHAEIGPPAQWQRISELLDRVQREAVTP